MVTKEEIDRAITCLSYRLDIPTKPKWRFAEEDEDVEEWYDKENETLVIAPDTDPDLASIAHEYFHWFTDQWSKDPEHYSDEGIADAITDTLAELARSCRKFIEWPEIPTLERHTKEIDIEPETPEDKNIIYDEMVKLYPELGEESGKR